MTEGAPASQSQRWHRDTGNKKYVKMFIYLNNVDKGAGPFVFVKKSQPGGKWYKLFPQLNPYSEKSGRVEDSALENAVPKEDILECTGKAGTLVFADTVGLHKGSYSTTASRFASIITYFSEHSMEVGKRDRLVYPQGFEESITDCSEAVKFTTLV